MSLNRKIINRLPLLFVFSAIGFLSSCSDVTPTVDLGVFNLHTEAQQAYIDSPDHEKIDADGKADLDKQNPVTFTIKDKNNFNNYKVYYSYIHTFNDPEIKEEDYVISNDKNVSITNLEFNKLYFFKVVANDLYTVENGTFITDNGIIHNYDVDGLKNFRDMGGYKTELGQFKTNMIYRCSELNHNEEGIEESDSIITDKGADFLINKLHIKTEIDLRKADEHFPEEYIENSILKVKYGADVKLFQMDLDWNGIHIDIDDDRSQKIMQFFEIISDESNYPIIFHCHIGTDRTGMFAAAIHSLLGGSEDHIYRDYMFSNFAYIGGSRSEDGLNTSYMNAYKKSKGESVSEKAYNLLNEKVGVPAEQLDNIRNILLVKETKQ